MRRRLYGLSVAFCMAFAVAASLPVYGQGPAIVRQLPKVPGAVRKTKEAKQARRVAEFDRLARMTPEQRQKALDKLPPERREKIEQGLRQYQNMNPENRERLRNFQNLPPEQRDTIRQNYRRMQDLPQDRRIMVRRELQQLRNLTPEERDKRMQSDAFRKRFDANEQSLIHDTVANLPDSE